MTSLNKICSKKGCNEQAVYKYSGTRFYCPKHYRFTQMRHQAKTRNKYKPSFEELERLLIECGPEMQCTNCHRIMIWHGQSRKLDGVISLQHNNNGSIQFLCFGCNSAHGNSQLGDKYFDLKNNEKYCADCKTILNKNQFYKNNRSRDKLKWICKACHKKRECKRRFLKNENNLYF